VGNKFNGAMGYAFGESIYLGSKADKKAAAEYALNAVPSLGPINDSKTKKQIEELKEIASSPVSGLPGMSGIKKRLGLDNPSYFEGAYDDIPANYYPLQVAVLTVQGGRQLAQVFSAKGAALDVPPTAVEDKDLLQEYVDKMNAAARKYKHGISGLPGMGGLTDTLKSPIVLVGLAAAAGFFLLRKKGK